MLTSHYLILIGISFVISIPVAYYFMGKWLENFYELYRVDFGWGVFAIGGLIALTIATLTISKESYKAAVNNPVKGLRSE